MIESVAAILDHLILLHEKLKTSADEKKAAILDGDFSALSAILNREEALVTELAQTEAKRQELFASATRVANLPAATTISEWAEKIEDPAQKQLIEEKQLKLAEEIVALKNQNALNQDLIKQSLSWVQINMNLINPRQEPGNYRPPTKNKTSETGVPVSSTFNSRA